MADERDKLAVVFDHRGITANGEPYENLAMAGIDPFDHVVSRMPIPIEVISPVTIPTGVYVADLVEGLNQTQVLAVLANFFSKVEQAHD